MLNTPTYGRNQVFYMLQRCQKMATRVALKCLLMETMLLLLFQRVCAVLSRKSFVVVNMAASKGIGI